jgi:rubrerythrin
MAARSDVDLLVDLLGVEHRLISAYEAALRRDAIEPELGGALLDHEREHVRALERALRGRGSPQASVPAPELTAALRDRRAFARYALERESEAVAGYRLAAAQVASAELRQALGSIMACEAAHEVALRDALGAGSLVD